MQYKIAVVKDILVKEKISDDEIIIIQEEILSKIGLIPEEEQLPVINSDYLKIVATVLSLFKLIGYQR